MMAGLDAHWWWLIGAALLGVLEIVLPGVFFIWLAAAATLTGVLVMALDLELPFQFALFGLLAISAVYSGRRAYDRNPVSSSDPKLNDRTARIIGQTVVVVSAIENGTGKVKVGDGEWVARGPDAPIGCRMLVTGADGTCLTVEKVAVLDSPNIG